jgi:type IV pilus assembly protein PilB
VVVGELEINAAIDKYYSVADSVREIIGEDTNETDGDQIESAAIEAVGVAGDTTVVKLVNLLLSRAIQDGASDIHIEPDEKKLRIRFRINGVMREEAAPPKRLQAEVISRIKIASEMDVSEKRIPQDGRMAIKIGDRNVDLRISTLPTIHGEKVVVRILDRKNLRSGLEELGMRTSLADKWRQLIQKPEGLLLLSGPTSSGKTSTLYASLQEINDIEKNIVTVEDPVEYSLPLINQIQINEKAGLTFASALRSMLRQNPDIIMVGEIRDSETAAMAIRAALTGHLVLSTIHTNDSIATITRLIDMGIERYMVASAIEAVLAQRLVRTICPDCIKESKIPRSKIEKIATISLPDDIKFFIGQGCINCRGTGFGGLTGIFELVTINDTIRELILSQKSEATIYEEAVGHGFHPIFEAGIELVKEGITTVDEVLRVTSPVIKDEFAPPLPIRSSIL